MKIRILRWLCLVLCLGVFPTTVVGLDKPILKFDKVVPNVFVGTQYVPLYPILSDIKGPSLTVNFFVVANEDRTELVLIDSPVVVPDKDGVLIVDLLTPFLDVLKTNFPGATIKAVLLTHDHMDHISGAINFFVTSGIPVYASTLDVTTEPAGMFDFDTMTGMPLNLLVTGIGPGFQLPFDKGALTAIDLKGHTPGQLGYALTDASGDKIKGLFAGDALLAPEKDYPGDELLMDTTYAFRLMVLANDTYSAKDWLKSVKDLRKQLTEQVKLFPAHGAVQDGVFWNDPLGYLDYTLFLLKMFNPDKTKEGI